MAVGSDPRGPGVQALLQSSPDGARYLTPPSPRASSGTDTDLLRYCGVCTKSCVSLLLLHSKLPQTQWVKQPRFLSHTFPGSATHSLVESSALGLQPRLRLWSHLKLRALFQTGCWQKSVPCRCGTEALSSWRPPAVSCHVGLFIVRPHQSHLHLPGQGESHSRQSANTVLYNVVQSRE